MNDYLLRYAIDNVWCNLGMDRQFQYQLRQLTPRYGTRRYYTVDGDRYDLPFENERDWFHVYQIGQVVPSHLALPKTYNQWMTLESLANDHKMLGEVYVDSGVQYSRANTWILLTHNQNLFVCVKILPLFPDPDEHQPYIHFYQNAFYQSKRSADSTKWFIEARSIRPKTTADLRQWQIKILERMEELGDGYFPLCWVNGRLVQEISLVTAGAGDYCEWVLDTSIYRIAEYRLGSTPTFTSTLDKMNKYIIHLPKDKSTTTIEFHDDLAVFLCKNDNAMQRFSGVHYHHNDGKWMRQLTHRDWSIPVGKVQSLIASHPEDPRHPTDPAKWPSDKWKTSDPIYLRVYHRRSGYERPIIADASRIQELYKLKDADIIRAMRGADSIPVWHAANLEQAAYVRFMSADPEVIYPITFQDPHKVNEAKKAAQDFAGDVFGYHEAAHLLANNPTKVVTEQGTRVANIPYVYWENATVFEYDNKGLLQDWHYHTGGSRYYPRSTTTAWVECITGVGSNDLQGVYGNDPVPLPGGYEFRTYFNPVEMFVNTDKWIDITDLPNRHEYGFLDETVEPNVWRWTIPASKGQGLVRRAHRFFLDVRRFNKNDGIIRFSFRHVSNASGQDTEELMEIPFGQLDVFLADENGQNGRGLVEGLDYTVLPGPTPRETQVVISNLEYLYDVNTVIIRGTGFCSSDFQMYKPGEIGFVEFGVLSGNGVYDIHTHKVQRVLVDGHYRSAEDIKFDETAGNAVIADERNGAPFQIQTPQVVFRDVYRPDAEARRIDDDKDKQVSDYLTEYFPMRTRTTSDKIKERYHVISVYANKLLHDLQKGVLKPPIVGGRMTELDVANAVKRYDWLKPFDILNQDYNENHVEVYPHWHPTAQGLDIQQYDFYVKALKLGLRRPLDLSQFIIITRT